MANLATGALAVPDLDGRGTHRLLVSESERRLRSGASQWVERELALGAKVIWKGWLAPEQRVEQHWIVGPEGARTGRDALASGQLEFTDIPTVIARCGGTSEGLFALQENEVLRALDDGWPSVAMSQESSRRPIADRAEAAAFAVQEGGYDTLLAAWPLSVLCQLDVPRETEAHVWESLAVHHDEIVDGPWSAVSEGDAWVPSGELDAHVARRFGAAVHGAHRAVHARGGGDLHVDLGAVTFLDVACAEILFVAARSAPDGGRTVLHRPSRTVRRLLEALQPPASVVLAPPGERG